MAEKKYFKHKLKKDDTVNSISLELGITPFEVVGFHNANCKNEDVIIHNIPIHLTEIFVYPYIRELKKENYPAVVFNGLSTLQVKPDNKKNNYGVTYTISNGDNQIDTMSFQVSVICKKKDQTGLHYEIERISNTFINNEETTSIADELAEKVAKVLYPLNIVVDETGKWTEITNFDDIEKRWNTLKSKIFEDYEGDWVQKYVELNEQTLASKSNIEMALKYDWFLNTLFGGIYVNYTYKFNFKNTISFPILANVKPLIYSVDQTIDPYLDEFLQIDLEQKGVLAEERSKADLQNKLAFPQHSVEDKGVEKATGAFKAKYFLNTKSNVIESVYLECSVILDKLKKVEIVISIIE